MTVNLETELRANKISIITLLAEQLVQYKYNEFKDFKIAEDKSIAYLDATIDLLTKKVANAKELSAKLITFDKTESDRKNLTPEELKELEAAQKRNAETIDSYLATMEPRASFKANIHAPNTVVLRYKGKGANNDFSKQYPFGVLM